MRKKDPSILSVQNEAGCSRKLSGHTSLLRKSEAMNRVNGNLEGVT